MYKFSKKSQDNLYTCDTQLIRLFSEVIKHTDCTVLCGHRTIEEQTILYEAKKSMTMKSKHLLFPSMAVDVVPYPVDWSDFKRFYHFTGFVRGVASQMNIQIRCGCDWDGDFSFSDQTFHDLPHFERVFGD